MNASPNPIDQLAARLDALEGRVQALEGSRREAGRVSSGSITEQAPLLGLQEPLPQIASVFPVLGSGLLGIAGAYLLRAISGANLLPRTAVSLIAALYAIAWLFAGARTGRGKVASIVDVTVSFLILSPMLWEMTVRLGAMPGTVAAMVLALYAAAAIAIGIWRSQAVFSIAFAGSAILAIALSIATHAMAEFTLLLLAMCVVCEYSGRKLVGRGVGIVVSLSADLGVWTLLEIYRLDPAGRPDYPKVSVVLVLASAMLLLSVEIAAVTRKVLANHPLPLFLSVQAMVAFGIAAIGLKWLARDSASTVLGILCLVMAAGCIAAAFGPARQNIQSPNQRVLSVWVACLVVGAIFAFLPLAAGSAALAVIAVVTIAIARRAKSRMPEWQGAVFILIAAGGSGMLNWAAAALGGRAPTAPGIATLTTAACAVLAYIAAGERLDEELRIQVLHLILALLTGFAVTAWIAGVLLDLTKLALTPDVTHLALIRTLAICASALGMAVAGERLMKPSLTRTAYTALVFVTVKLFFEDLRHGHMEFIAGSIFLVALTLIALPRLTRANRKSSRRGLESEVRQLNGRHQASSIRIDRE